jgi:hypothetical protein
MIPEDDAKYKEVINILKGLPDVNAPKNFETELMRKIKAGNLEEKLSLWDRIFVPSRLIPSAALAITAVIVLFVMNINSGEIDNPLLVEPRIREDVIANTDAISLEDKYSTPESDIAKKSEREVKRDLVTMDTNIAEFKDELLSKRNKPGFSMGTSVTEASFIDKKGLNFRQVNLNEEEKVIVNQLKERIESLFKKSKN